MCLECTSLNKPYQYAYRGHTNSKAETAYFFIKPQPSNQFMSKGFCSSLFRRKSYLCWLVRRLDECSNDESDDDTNDNIGD